MAPKSKSSKSKSSTSSPSPDENPASEHEAGDPGHAPEVDESGKVQDKAGTHYCPGCGRRYDDPATCQGTTTAPHPPIETAPVSELKKGDDQHTPAPPSGDGI